MLYILVSMADGYTHAAGTWRDRGTHQARVATGTGHICAVKLGVTRRTAHSHLR